MLNSFFVYHHVQKLSWLLCCFVYDSLFFHCISKFCLCEWLSKVMIYKLFWRRITLRNTYLSISCVVKNQKFLYIFESHFFIKKDAKSALNKHYFVKNNQKRTSNGDIVKTFVRKGNPQTSFFFAFHKEKSRRNAWRHAN